MANSIVGGAGAAWGGNATDNSGAVIAVAGFAADTICGRPLILGQVGGNVAAVTSITGIDSIVAGIGKRPGRHFVRTGRGADVGESNGPVDMGGLQVHAGVVGIGQVTTGTVGTNGRTIGAT